jgi:hypothetical protein
MVTGNMGMPEDTRRAGEVSAGSLAQAQSIPLATDGLADASVPASVPKWNLILPQNPIAQLGTGVEQQLDFNIQCQDVGKIQNILVNFNYTIEVGKTPVIVPTPYFVTRIDFFAPDGSTLETVYNDNLWVETCSLLTDQAVNTVSPLFNFAVNNNASLSVSGASGSISNSYTSGSLNVSRTVTTNANLKVVAGGTTGNTPPFGEVTGAGTLTGTIGGVDTISTGTTAGTFSSATLAGNAILSNYTNAVAFTPAASSGATYNHWLSLNNTFLGATQPYLRGCGSGYFKVRLYLSPNLASDGSQATQGTLTSNWTYLWVQEAVLSENAERALMYAHRSGIQYSSVVRNQYSLTMAAVAAGGNSSTLQLQGFFAESAGLYFMFKPSNSNANCLTRTPVAYLYLQDSQGRQLTQNMSTQLIEAIVSPSVVPVSSYFINAASQTTYIFPFCTNLTRVIEGKSLGSYQLTGNERLVLQTDATNALAGGSIFNAISWDYAKLVVVNHTARQYVLGSNS